MRKDEFPIVDKIVQDSINEVLDDIRADIDKLTVYYTTKDKGINLISQNAVNRILDKYKTQSEVINDDNCSASEGTSKVN